MVKRQVHIPRVKTTVSKKKIKKIVKEVIKESKSKRRGELFAPGGSNMTIAEAFEIVLDFTIKEPSKLNERQKEAIKLIEGLAVGSFGLKK